MWSCLTQKQHINAWDMHTHRSAAHTIDTASYK